VHADFGDWQLALAAYNWGEGAVSRAIDKNQRKRKPTDYRSLKMPKETANYLPKLQAVKNIIADPARYGILLEEIPNQPYFIRVNVPSQIDVKRAAELADVPLEEFRSLNPAHNRPVITSAGERTVLLPVEKAETFANNLQANDEPLVSWQTYQLKPNEKIEQVAARYGLTVNTLKQVNGIGTRKRLRPGQTLLVPTPAAMQDANLEQSIDPLEFQSAGPEMETYRVKHSDTLPRIANHFHVSQRQIIRWNHLKGGRIRPGQTLTIYPDSAPVAKRTTVRAKAPRQVQTVKVKAPARKAPVQTSSKQHLVRN
jgi:membrane-bound lytic murein transglycosylase D